MATKKRTLRNVKKAAQLAATQKHVIAATKQTNKAVKQLAKASQQVAKAQAKQTNAKLKVTKSQQKETQAKINATAKKIQIQARESELQSIENLLGEEFESLAQARRALQRETKKVVEKVTKSLRKKAAPTKRAPEPVQEKEPTKKVTRIKVARKYSYTLSELKPAHVRTLNAFLRDRVSAEQLTQSALNKGEYIAFQVPFVHLDTKLNLHTSYASSYQLFSSFESMFKNISGYAFMGTRWETSMLSSLKIVRFGDDMREAGANDFQIQSSFKRNKRQEKESNDARRRKVGRTIKKMQKEMEQLKAENIKLKKGKQK